MSAYSGFSENATRIKAKYHLVFWAIYFAFNTLRWGSYYGDFVLSLKGNLVEFPLHIILCYITIYLLIPKLIYKRRFILFTVLVISFIFVLTFAKYELTYWLISHNVWPEGPERTSSFSFNYALVMMLGEFYVLSFVTAIKVTTDFLQASSRAARLEKAQMETELRFLRSQISPHFFFNTLNNIYSLSLEKSGKTPDVVLKLSELMRYLVYDTKPKKQNLAKEIKCIQNYLELERIRYGDSLLLDVQVTGDPADKKIAPMLLIPFVENAFKHGANKKIGEVFIKIRFLIEEDFLYFSILNTATKEDPVPNKTHGGIGIENIKKRLELGYKREDYILKIDTPDDEFKVDLKLRLL